MYPTENGRQDQEFSSVIGSITAPQILGPNLCQWYLVWRKGFTCEVKDIEMGRLSWIIWVHPKCNCMCPYKREGKRGLTCTEKAAM